MDKTVFIISYFFPPVGGAGVQRVAKFVKYLPEFGWRSIVLTAENPSVPLFDESLLSEIPDSTTILRAKTLEPDYSAKKAVSAASKNSSSGNSILKLLKLIVRRVATGVLQPDPQVLWLPAAYSKACHVIKKDKPDVIFASAPPFSGLILAAKLARKFNIPLVLDYRDEWDISNSVWENKKIGLLSIKIQTRMQRYAVCSASAIIATTELSKLALQEKTEKWQVKPLLHCIYNGYDKTDFENLERASAPGVQKKYQLAYVGTLWNLTSIEPLVSAIGLLSEESPNLTEHLELVLAGRRTSEQEEILARLENTNATVTCYEYLDHGEAIKTISNANGLVLLLSDFEFAGRVVPGKLFEYIATGNAIISIAPKGEVWKLLADYPLADCAAPTDTATISSILATNIERFLMHGKDKVKQFDAERYERRELTRQLTGIFEKMGP